MAYPERLGFSNRTMKNILPPALRNKKRSDFSLVLHGAMTRSEYLLKWYRIEESLRKQTSKKL